MEKLWDVFWRQRHVTVAAADEQSAIVAAAKEFGVRWQEYSYYAYCAVYPAGKEKR